MLNGNTGGFNEILESIDRVRKQDLQKVRKKVGSMTRYMISVMRS